MLDLPRLDRYTALFLILKTVFNFKSPDIKFLLAPNLGLEKESFRVVRI